MPYSHKSIISAANPNFGLLSTAYALAAFDPFQAARTHLILCANDYADFANTTIPVLARFSENVHEDLRERMLHLLSKYFKYEKHFHVRGAGIFRAAFNGIVVGYSRMMVNTEIGVPRDGHDGQKLDETVMGELEAPPKPDDLNVEQDAPFPNDADSDVSAHTEPRSSTNETYFRSDRRDSAYSSQTTKNGANVQNRPASCIPDPPTPKHKTLFEDCDGLHQTSTSAYPPISAPRYRPTVNLDDIPRAFQNWDWAHVLFKHLSLGDFDMRKIRCIRKSSGSFHIVQIWEVLYGPDQGKYVIKVPRSGTEKKWGLTDSCIVHCEFSTMRVIKAQTNCPIPEPIACDSTCAPQPRNVMGAPYILMRAMEGVQAQHIWFDIDEHGGGDIDAAMNPTAAMEAKRACFVKSLARAMSELGKISFPRIGSLMCYADGSGFIGNTYTWRRCRERGGFEAQTTEPTFAESQEYWRRNLDGACPWVPGSHDELPHHQLKQNGQRMVMECIMDSDVFKASRAGTEDRETFVLSHTDLNLQNIICDPRTGEVVGIIDWDGACTVPRHIGFSALPLFLIGDYFNNIPGAIRIPIPDLVKYRKIYTEAMLEATGPEGDGKYTAKSALFQAIHGSQFGHQFLGCEEDAVGKVLGQCEGLGEVTADEVCMLLGAESWLLKKEVVELEVQKVMAC
ncbi:hypothetical protein CC80DRAFT_123487 [Byssothecium circinans]|uniref:Aminoglycoside phosphotransferase domain-containing protein n=1 Tax=Byssothecium circinans TaxID=147558 RepID=A0A6A5TP13_9PLEO|nr:hypothetical protein CC80DRAFT_123487 [Byssothecium circinans]